VECCRAVPETATATCNQQVAAAMQADNETGCQVVLDGYRRAGMCTGDGPKHGTSAPNDGGTLPGTGSAASPVCAGYLACATKATPAAASALLAAYAPSGTCWQTSETAAICNAACTKGLEELHAAYPTDDACALCHADADCGGATPACNPDRGECAECSTDAHCHGATPACDHARHVCVACSRDAHCVDPRLPVCDQSANRCVECARGANCASGVCNGNRCCQRAQRCRSSACGTEDDGCGGSIDCGTCSVGTCSFGRCSTVGNTCTLGDKTCAADELCMYNAWSLSYECNVYRVDGQAIAGTPCPDTMSSTCRGPVDTVQTFGCAYNRATSREECAQYCLATAECKPGLTCTPSPYGPIDMRLPGYCL
jgi:hypothetical protein